MKYTLKQLIIVVFFMFLQTTLSIDTVLAQNFVIDQQFRELRDDMLLEKLDSLYKDSYIQNPELAAEIAYAMIKTGGERNNKSLKMKGFANLSDFYYRRSKYDSVLYYANQVIQLRQDHETNLNIGSAYMHQCNVNIIRGNYSEAEVNGLQALEVFTQLNDTFQMAKTKKNLSYIYKDRGEYDKAMDYAMEALDFFEQSNDSMIIASGLGTVANIYLSIGNLKLAKAYFMRAKHFLAHYESSLTYSQVLQAIAGIYRQANKTDSSVVLFEEALSLARKNNNSLLIGKILMNLANALKADNQIDQAITRFKEAEEIFTQIQSEKDINQVTYSLGETYFESGDLKNGEHFLLQALETSDRIGHALIYEGTLKQLYLLYAANKNFEKAYNYLQLYSNYHDSIQSEKIQLKIADLETKYESAKKEQKISELTHQQQIEQVKKKNQRLIFLGISIMLMLLLFIMWQKRRREKLVYAQKELLHVQEKQLAEAELEKQKLREEELEQSIQFKSRQLSTHALHMMQKNSILQELQAKLKSLSRKVSDEDKKHLKSINLQINQSLLSDKEWDLFKRYFEAVNKDFYEKLLKINADLTNYEQRLCALIKLNMNSHEMASVLNISPNSVKSARYRLKKKLGLNAEADLEAFIRGIA